MISNTANPTPARMPRPSRADLRNPHHTMPATATVRATRTDTVPIPDGSRSRSRSNITRKTTARSHLWTAAGDRRAYHQSRMSSPGEATLPLGEQAPTPITRHAPYRTFGHVPHTGTSSIGQATARYAPVDTFRRCVESRDQASGLRAAIASATMEMAISSGVDAPMSRPAGPRTRSSQWTPRKASQSWRSCCIRGDPIEAM